MSALWVLLLLASVSVLNASAPTAKPTLSPTRNPTLTPTRSPTLTPTRSPTRTPTAMPTATPSSSKPTAKPTAVPTSAPTAIPTPINAIPHSDIPIAMHQLVVVQSADSSVIRLKAFDLNSFNVRLSSMISTILRSLVEKMLYIIIDRVQDFVATDIGDAVPAVAGVQLLWLRAKGGRESHRSRHDRHGLEQPNLLQTAVPGCRRAEQGQYLMSWLLEYMF